MGGRGWGRGVMGSSRVTQPVIGCGLLAGNAQVSDPNRVSGTHKLAEVDLSAHPEYLWAVDLRATDWRAQHPEPELLRGEPWWQPPGSS